MFYIFIITLVVQSLIVTESLPLNVRTALFAPGDLAKKRWNKGEIALLRARKYFQGLIPPLEVTRSPDYINYLIRYIEHCYATVNKAALDADTKIILTVAASDVFGGYLKMVALPVTKNAYYSGDVSIREALKLLTLYENIKDQLHTTGKGWSEPLKYIGKARNRGVRSKLILPRIKLKHPCKLLLYRKNNDENVSMPMPSIDWKTHIMFVPLARTPIVDLKSPHVSSVLMLFHQAATECERSIAPGSRNFRSSFDDWANETVLPHLNDDDFYTAFKGILSILEIPDFTPSEDKIPDNYFKTLFPNMSTKAMVVIAVLALELLCCIPTLLYCVNKRKKRCPRSNFAKIKKKIGYNKKTVFYNLSPRSSSFHSDTRTSSVINSNYNKKSINNKISSDLSPSSSTRPTYSSVSDVITTADEAPSIRKLSNQTLKHENSQSLRYKITETDHIDVTQHQTQVSDMTLLPRRTSSKYASNDTGDTIALTTVVPQDIVVCNVVRKSKRFRPRHSGESLSPATYNAYPILDNESAANNISNTVNELKLGIFDDKLETVMRFSSDKTVVTPRASKANNKNSETNANRPKKENKERVERPRQMGEISKQTPQEVVLHYRKELIKSEVKKNKKTKASKIPKKVKLPMNDCDFSSSGARWRDAECSLRKSMIPKSGQALDDSALYSSSSKKRELNVTL